jgi:uncharacterized protein YcfJ
MHKVWLLFALLAGNTTVLSDSTTLDAAIGGGLGGAAGAAIGNEVAGRDGAIVGGALGGAVGAALNTEDDTKHGPLPRRHHAPPPQPRPVYRFCPPGQAKKGRC